MSAPAPRPDRPAVLVDTHAHLQLPEFEADRAEVLVRARAAGVAAVVVVSTDVASSRQAVALAEAEDMVYAAVGIHPNDSAAAGEAEVEAIRTLAQHRKVVAIGEIGLDFYWKTVPASRQEDIFVRQLRLAAELGKPVIVHNRDAGAAILATLQQAGVRQLAGVFHCFSENAAYARRVLDLGCHVSFTGNVTYRKSTLPEVARQVPLARLLLETDAPFMAPVPHRGQRNEPAFVAVLAAKLAEILGMSLADLCRETTANAARLFGLTLEHAP